MPQIRLVQVPDGSFIYELYVLKGANKFEYFGRLVPDTEELRVQWLQRPPDGMIAECRYDENYPTKWRFMRFREDKDTPNFIDVAHKIMQSIQQGVALPVVRIAGGRCGWVGEAF